MCKITDSSSLAARFAIVESHNGKILVSFRLKPEPHLRGEAEMVARGDPQKIMQSTDSIETFSTRK
jgi:hypothetical protein